MKSRIRLILCAVIALAGVAVPAQSTAQTLHLVLVGSTADPKLEPAVKNDVMRFRAFMVAAAKAAGLGFSETSLVRDELTRASVESAIEKLAVKATDTIVFYYSGHGAAMRNSSWPELDLQPHTPFADLHRILARKSARLLLVVLDACNEKEITGPDTSNLASTAPPIPAVARKLLADATGQVILAAARDGREAYATDAGSRFTTALLTALARKRDAATATWQEVYKDAESQTIRANEKQRPHAQFVPK